MPKKKKKTQTGVSGYLKKKSKAKKELDKVFEKPKRKKRKK